jgi:hypothetical protein
MSLRSNVVMETFKTLKSKEAIISTLENCDQGLFHPRAKKALMQALDPQGTTAIVWYLFGDDSKHDENRTAFEYESMVMAWEIIWTWMQETNLVPQKKLIKKQTEYMRTVPDTTIYFELTLWNKAIELCSIHKKITLYLASKPTKLDDLVEAAKFALLDTLLADLSTDLLSTAIRPLNNYVDNFSSNDETLRLLQQDPKKIYADKKVVWNFFMEQLTRQPVFQVAIPSVHLKLVNTQLNWIKKLFQHGIGLYFNSLKKVAPFTFIPSADNLVHYATNYFLKCMEEFSLPPTITFSYDIPTATAAATPKSPHWASLHAVPVRSSIQAAASSPSPK